MNCPICSTSCEETFQKSFIPYSLCPNCSCCFANKEIPNEVILTENDSYGARNQREINLERLRRVEEEHMPTKVLDFGCGNGEMSELIKTEKTYSVLSIDKNTELQLKDIPIASIDTIIMTEVIEHILNPIELFKKFNSIMLETGIIYIESSFTDFLGNPKNASYIDPKIGHSLVHSFRSLKRLGDLSGFKVKQYSSNVFFFKKELCQK